MNGYLSDTVCRCVVVGNQSYRYTYSTSCTCIPAQTRDQNPVVAQLLHLDLRLHQHRNYRSMYRYMYMMYYMYMYILYDVRAIIMCRYSVPAVVVGFAVVMDGVLLTS